MRGPQLGGIVQGVVVEVLEQECLVSATTTPVALRAAAVGAVQRAMKDASPVILEPLMSVVVRQPAPSLMYIVTYAYRKRVSLVVDRARWL